MRFGGLAASESPRPALQGISRSKTNLVGTSVLHMNNREADSTARRRLDFRREAPGGTRPVSRSHSSSFSDSPEILTLGSLKQCTEFHQTADLLCDSRTSAQTQEDIQAQEIRNFIAQGPPTENQAQYDAIVREALARRSEDLLRTEAWMFEPQSLDHGNKQS